MTGLASANVYSFKVSAVNILGESTISPSIFVINANLPSKPANPPVITLVTPNSISLNLTPIPSANNGGSPITSYIVEMDDGLGGAFQTVSDSLTTSLILSGLQPSRLYRIKYAGRNIIYDSGNMFQCDSLQFSDLVTVLTAVGPSSPTGLQQDISLRYSDALVFNWIAPASNGGSPLQQYTLELSVPDTTQISLFYVSV